MHAIRPLLALAAACVGSLAAQTTTTTAATPLPDPHMRITTLGPGGWRVRLGPSNVGTLLDTPQARALWMPPMQSLAEAVGDALADEAVAQAAQQRFLDYEGTVHAAVWWSERRGHDLQSMWIVAEPDGRTDMARLAADLAALQDTGRGAWEETTIDGEAMRIQEAGRMAMSEARLIGGCVVMAVTNSASEPLAAMLAAAKSCAAKAAGSKTAPQQPPLVVEFAPVATLAQVFDLVPDASWLGRLGLDGVQAITATLTTAGPHLQAEAAVRFAAAPQRLLAALTPARTALPRLAHALPAGAPTFRLGHFGFQAMWRVITEVAAFEMNSTPAEIAAEAKAAVGIDPGAGFFDLLGDEVLMTTQTVDEDERPAKATWAIAVAAVDGPALQRNLQTLLDGAKPHLTRQESTTIAGVPFSRYGNVLGYPLWIGVGARAMYLAGGGDAEGELAALIPAAEAPPADAAPAALDPALAGLQRALPAGMSGAARYDLQHGSLLVDLVTGGLEGSLAGMLLRGVRGDDDAAEAQEALAAAKEEWLALLRAHRLTSLRSATGYADGTWRFRLYW